MQAAGVEPAIDVVEDGFEAVYLVGRDRSAVPSLTRLSPSISDTIRRGAPSRDAISVAASASVGDTIAPSVNATAHGRPIPACATTATAVIVAATRPRASNMIEERAGIQERRKHRHQHDLRRERDLRQPRDEPHRDPAQHEQDRQGQPERRRERKQRPHRYQKPEELEILMSAEMHASDSSCRGGRSVPDTMVVVMLVAVAEPRGRRGARLGGSAFRRPSGLRGDASPPRPPGPLG